MRPAPVPLFNYKKRQRQALVSDPDLTGRFEEKRQFQENSNPAENRCITPSIANKSNKPNVSNTNFPSGHSHKFPSNKQAPGLMDMKGKFNSVGNRSSNFSTVNQANTNNASKSSTHSTNTYGDQQTSSSFSNRNRGQGFGNSYTSNHNAGQGKFSQGRGRLRLNNFSSPHVRAGQTVTARSGFNTNNGPGGSKQAHPNPWGGSSTSSNSRQQYDNACSSDKQATFKSSFASKGPNRSSTVSSTAAGVSKMQNVDKASFSKSKPIDMPKTPNELTLKRNFNNRFNENAFSFEDDSLLNNKQKKPVQTQSTTKRKSDKPVKDTSMRIFTCPIASLKSWVELKVYDGPVMFEVYGLLDSATVRDSTGTGKEFMLRDDTDSIKCVFYEIDRELPRLTRGQVHRVVGVADKRRGILQVVSVRPAQKEERKVCQAAGASSQAEMEQLAARTNEQ
ncbi:hypothetical protein RRG08_053121 [Elysia crispata]|uniref:Spermatogenesis-associated protein 22 n=1 Tax=Elysia crispata TaxID=231223 RepID=A0AAE1AIE6_9GAST|nr:hypothetical protein RRG08_053121 [Elysia crispata]